VSQWQLSGHLRHFIAYKLHHNAFGGRAPPGPTGGAYSVPTPTHLIAGFRGLFLREGKGRTGTERKGPGREEEKGIKGKGREEWSCPFQILKDSGTEDT